MSHSFDPVPEDLPAKRPIYRPPMGLPVRDEGRRMSAVVSVVLHLLIALFLIVPLYYRVTTIVPIEQGAGGAGPAGGGGGGRGGDRGARESLRFVRVARDPVPTPKTLPPVPTPEVPKVQPPAIPPTPPVQPQTKRDDAVLPAPQQVVASTVGAGPGSGNDGTAGNGPGSGGGVGSGVGAGRGSGVGPGTGGGSQVNYPPQPIEFFLPPMPPPSSVKGTHFIAEFDVDSTGRVLDFKFSETRDGDYNRRISSILRSMRFRPGTRADGTPLRMKAQVGYEF